MTSLDPDGDAGRRATPPSADAVDVVLRDQPTMLSIPRVAELLSTTAPTIRRMVDQGDLRAVKLSRQWRVARDDLRSYLLTPSELEDPESPEDLSTD